MLAELFRRFATVRAAAPRAYWFVWWGTLMAYVSAAPDATAVNAWTTKNAESTAALRKLDAAKHGKLIDQIKRELTKKPMDP